MKGKGFIEDIWILTNTGIPMYYLSNDRDEHLTSGFLSAISIFTNIINVSEHYYFETSNKRITMTYCHSRKVIVCCVTDSCIKEKSSAAIRYYSEVNRRAF